MIILMSLITILLIAASSLFDSVLLNSFYLESQLLRLEPQSVLLPVRSPAPETVLSTQKQAVGIY